MKRQPSAFDTEAMAKTGDEQQAAFERRIAGRHRRPAQQDPVGLPLGQGLQTEAVHELASLIKRTVLSIQRSDLSGSCQSQK
jgi:hypothetical protein